MGTATAAASAGSILPFLPVCAIFSRVQTMVWLPDVDARDCTPGAVSKSVSECVPKVDTGREGETDRQRETERERACSTKESNPRQYCVCFFLFFFLLLFGTTKFNGAIPVAPWRSTNWSVPPHEKKTHVVEPVFVFRGLPPVWHVE